MNKTTTLHNGTKFLLPSERIAYQDHIKTRVYKIAEMLSRKKFLHKRQELDNITPHTRALKNIIMKEVEYELNNKKLTPEEWQTPFTM